MWWVEQGRVTDRGFKYKGNKGLNVDFGISRAEARCSLTVKQMDTSSLLDGINKDKLNSFHCTLARQAGLQILLLHSMKDSKTLFNKVSIKLESKLNKMHAWWWEVVCKYYSSIFHLLKEDCYE